MDALVSIGVMIALVAMIRWLSVQVCPWAIRGLERAAKRLFRVSWRCVWTVPINKVGMAMTLWLWTVAVAVLVTVTVGFGGAERLPAAAVLWGLVLLGWLAQRWWAERQFRPRDLPARRRWRDRR